jgi:ABC-type Zn2+ transport system substrate-binding protein/surface adhesin
MLKPILTAVALALASATAAWALPISQTGLLRPPTSSDLIQVGKKDKNKHHNNNHHNNKHHHSGKYHHGGKYYDHRYYYRPPNWQVLGCVGVGAVWYCP